MQDYSRIAGSDGVRSDQDEKTKLSSEYDLSQL